MRHSFTTLSDILDYSSSKFAKRTACDYVDGG
jgi:acyl-CoA synthetase (AMP-forming)/AMP-acid ligase II